MTAVLGLDTPLPEGVRASQVSDGHHSFGELYSFRLAYNALLFNEWALTRKYHVHKSRRHYEGDLCFGGTHFVVFALLPSGQITNHYKAEYWDLFDVPEYPTLKIPYDGHNSTDVLERMHIELGLGR